MLILVLFLHYFFLKKAFIFWDLTQPFVTFNLHREGIARVINECFIDVTCALLDLL